MTSSPGIRSTAARISTRGRQEAEGQRCVSLPVAAPPLPGAASLSLLPVSDPAAAATSSAKQLGAHEWLTNRARPPFIVASMTSGGTAAG